MDVQAELMERDTLIDQLTERLQQSIADREELQKQGEVLTHEVDLLKRQLADTLELMKKPQQFRENVNLPFLSLVIIFLTIFFNF